MWVCEQALRCADVAAVLAWLPQARADQLRRLHMAAGENAKPLFVMRPARAQAESSAAVLRVLVAVQPDSDELRVEILKRRGPPSVQPLVVPARQGRMAALLSRSRGWAGQAAPVAAPPAPSMQEPAHHVLDRTTAPA